MRSILKEVIHASLKGNFYGNWALNSPFKAGYFNFSRDILGLRFTIKLEKLSIYIFRTIKVSSGGYR